MYNDTPIEAVRRASHNTSLLITTQLLKDAMLAVIAPTRIIRAALDIIQSRAQDANKVDQRECTARIRDTATFAISALIECHKSDADREPLHAAIRAWATAGNESIESDKLDALTDATNGILRWRTELALAHLRTILDTALSKQTLRPMDVCDARDTAIDAVDIQKDQDGWQLKTAPSAFAESQEMSRLRGMEKGLMRPLDPSEDNHDAATVQSTVRTALQTWRASLDGKACMCSDTDSAAFRIR